MALSPRRCIPLRILCRGWPPVGSSHVLARKPFGKDSGLNLFPRLGHRYLPISGSQPYQYRLLSDVNAPKVNVSLTHGFLPSLVSAHCQYRPPKTSLAGDSDLHESPYTVPNALTLGRIIACPFLGYHIVQGNLEWATGILFFGGISDWVSSLVASRTDNRSWTAGLLGGGM